MAASRQSHTEDCRPTDVSLFRRVGEFNRRSSWTCMVRARRVIPFATGGGLESGEPVFAGRPLGGLNSDRQEGHSSSGVPGTGGSGGLELGGAIPSGRDGKSLLPETRQQDNGVQSYLRDVRGANRRDVLCASSSEPEQAYGVDSRTTFSSTPSTSGAPPWSARAWTRCGKS